MFEITFLGTAASVPSAGRGLSSLLVEHGRRRFLIDCGEGTQRQLMASGLGFRRLDTVLLTHGHLDHLLGLGGLAGTLNLWRSTERLAIHAGPAPLRLARRLLEEVVWPDGPPRLGLDWRELSPGPLLAARDLTVTAFPVRHAAPDCFGFLFEETPRQPLNRRCSTPLPSSAVRPWLRPRSRVRNPRAFRVSRMQPLRKSNRSSWRHWCPLMDACSTWWNC